MNKIQVNASFRSTLTRMGQLKNFRVCKKILKTMDSHLIVQGATHTGSVLHVSIKWTRQFHNIEKTKISSGNVPLRKQIAQEPISENNLNLIFVEIPF